MSVYPRVWEACWRKSFEVERRGPEGLASIGQRYRALRCVQGKWVPPKLSNDSKLFSLTRCGSPRVAKAMIVKESLRDVSLLEGVDAPLGLFKGELWYLTQ